MATVSLARAEQGGFAVLFSTADSVNPYGRVQWMRPGELTPDPYAGPANLRLTEASVGGRPIGAFMTFSEPITGFELYAYQVDCIDGVTRCYNPFVIDAYAEDRTVLGTVQTTMLVPSGTYPHGPRVYELLSFSSPPPMPICAWTVT